ncbi:MAG: hypothetical protein KC506_00515 [Nanoarchaeota archaeon]|nr:hypothetical protein [Nanoarchaeota archaeon]
MTFEEVFMKDVVFGSAFGALAAIGIMLAVLFVIALYVYTSYTWMIIARKLKYKREWLAWIPVASWAMMLQLGGFHWAWIFLVLIPILGWITLLVLLIIATWRIFEKRSYPGWLSLSMIIPKIGGILYLIIIGFVAYRDNRSERSMTTRKSPTKKKTAKKKRR